MNKIPSAAISRGLSLKAVLPAFEPISVSDIRFRSCCGQWADCQPGDLFIAVVDEDCDGHEFASQAIERGAVAIVTERLLAVDCPQFIVDDTRQAMGHVCQALAGNPSDLLTTIGVAGSDGKTVTSLLIDSILKQAGGAPETDSDLNRFEIQETPAKSQQIVRRSAGVAQWMADAVMNQTSHTILDVTTNTLATRQLSGAAFDIMALTNLRRDESGKYFSNDTFRSIIVRSLDYLKPHGIAILNADDLHSRELLDQIQTPALTIGIHQAAEVSARIVGKSTNEITFVMTAGNESCVVNSPMIGNHHVYNCLTAAATALALGIELQTIAIGLERAGQIPGRMEPISCGQDFNLYVDVARRPTPIAAALHAAKQHTPGRVWTLASISPEQTPEERRHLGDVLAKASDRVVLAPSMATTAIDYEPYHQVLDAFGNPAQVQIIPNRFRAIEWLLKNCPAGDTALILGNGERTIATVADGKWQVNDRDVCEAWLYESTSFAATTKPEPQIFNIEDYRKKRK